MKAEIGFLRSKVTRRIVWLFFLSALFPIILFALLSFTYVSDVLVQQAHSQLNHTGKLYGTSVLERLLFIDDKLRNAALIMRAKQLLQADELSSHLGAELNTLSLVSEDSKIDMLFIDNELPVDFHKYLGDGTANKKSLVYSEETSSGEIKIYIRLLLGQKDNINSSLVAEINNSYLWGDNETLPFSTNVCVTEGPDKIIFCSHQVPDQLLKLIDSTSFDSESEYLHWSLNGERYQAASWDVLFNSRFLGPSWKIIASQKESIALVPISTFNVIFPLVIVLSLLVTLVLSVLLIRRSMIPVERLIEGTQRVANKIFNQPVEVDSNDEFETLANSFNTMTTRLGKQIDALTMLSEIDQLILSNPKVEAVLLTILKRIHEITPCELISIALIDKDEPDKGRAHISIAGTKRVPKVEEITIPDVESAMLLTYSNTFNVNLRMDQWSFLGHLKKRGAEIVQIFPIVISDRLNAIVSLSYSNAPLLNDDELHYVRDLVDRLAVALATADRDERLYVQAHYDTLTSLPNRQLFNDRLEQQLIHAHRENQLIGLLYIDLDRFKTINDTFGHSVGDKLLQQTAVRLIHCVRETDTVARLSGDEFVVILSSLFSPKDASVISENIITRISKPFNIGAHEVFVSPSIGITIFPMDGNNSEELLKHADAAMYRAKELGNGKYMFFEEKMNLEDMERTSMEHDMRHAVQRNEFELLYQPQVNIQTGELIGVESLIRWNHPEHGVIYPSRFISLAEDTGIVDSIGEWVLRTACKQFKDWQSQGILMDHISVNVSSKQFIHEKFY